MCQTNLRNLFTKNHTKRREFNFSAQNTWFPLSIRTTFVSLPPKTVVSVPLNKVVLDYGKAEIANCIGKLAEALQKMGSTEKTGV